MATYKVKRKGRRYPKVFFSYEEARQFVRKRMRKWLSTTSVGTSSYRTPDGTNPSFMRDAGFTIERAMG